MSFPSLPDQFFRPRSIAIIGATKKAGFGSGLPAFLKRNGYGDRLYLINPRETEIEGLPVYRRVIDVPHRIDLAIIIVPKEHVHGVIQDCLEKEIREAARDLLKNIDDPGMGAPENHAQSVITLDHE